MFSGINKKVDFCLDAKASLLWLYTELLHFQNNNQCLSSSKMILVKLSLLLLLCVSARVVLCQDSQQEEVSSTISEEEPKKESLKLNTDPSTWEGWINTQVLAASRDPWNFLYYVFLCLSPFFCISAALSWKLSQQLEAQEKKRKRKALKKKEKKTEWFFIDKCFKDLLSHFGWSFRQWTG